MERKLGYAKVVMAKDGTVREGQVTIYDNWVRLGENNGARWYPKRKINRVYEPADR